MNDLDFDPSSDFFLRKLRLRTCLFESRKEFQVSNIFNGSQEQSNYIQLCFKIFRHGLVGHRTRENQDEFKAPYVIAYYAVDYVKNPKGKLVILKNARGVPKMAEQKSWLAHGVRKSTTLWPSDIKKYFNLNSFFFNLFHFVKYYFMLMKPNTRKDRKVLFFMQFFGSENKTHSFNFFPESENTS